MVTNDVQDELVEGFEPSALPPIAPDGSLELSALREMPRSPPRLCEAGPCRNYHHLRIQLDAARPLPVKQSDGSFAAPQAPDHHEDHHYCYPAVGIETKLGSLPVLQCNRWSPLSAEELANDAARTDAWLGSEAGLKFSGELATWQADQDARAAQSARDAEQAATDLEQMPIAPPIELVVMIGNGETRVMARWEDAMAYVIAKAISQFKEALPDHDLYRDAEPADYRAHLEVAGHVERAFGRAINPDYTVSQAGLSHGARLTLRKFIAGESNDDFGGES